MSVSFTEGKDIVGIPVIQMKHLHLAPRELRYWIGTGETFLLTANFKPVAIIRKITDQDLHNNERILGGRKANVMTLEQIRKERDDFLFTLMREVPVFLFYKNKNNKEKALAVFEPRIPEKYLESYKAFRRMQLKKVAVGHPKELEKGEIGESQQTHVISISDLGRSQFKLRLRIYAGDDIIVSYRGYPFMFIRPIAEDEDVEGLERVTMQDLLRERDKVVSLIGKKESLLITYHNKGLALASPEIPQISLDRAIEIHPDIKRF